MRISDWSSDVCSSDLNLTLDGRQALKKLLAANKRLNTAYLLKESFGQLWSYRTERGARAFFERWKQSLRWQRLAPYQKFVRMIERHWRYEEHTSELQSLMRISYAVFCLKKKHNDSRQRHTHRRSRPE